MKVALLSGGVGGARLARGLAGELGDDLTVVVNVGDDHEIYGLEVSPDLDTVIYTLANQEGPQGWGLAGDSFAAMEQLEGLGEETSFRIGDRDLGTNLFRSILLHRGTPLSAVTARIRHRFGLGPAVLPVSDDRVRTRVLTEDGAWRSFQDYFVLRGHRDEVIDVRFEGAAAAKPAPGVIDAIDGADLVLVGPSNPVLSIWPILAVPGVAESISSARRVMAVSPLFGGKALKGPADRVLRSLGFPGGNQGVAAAYEGLLDDLVIDQGDEDDRSTLEELGLAVHVTDTRMVDAPTAERFASRLLASA